MYDPRFHTPYRLSNALAILCVCAFLSTYALADHEIVAWRAEFIFLAGLFAGMGGVFGFFSGKKFELLGRPILYLPEAGPEKNDEKRAWGLTMAVFYFVMLAVGYALYDS